MKDIRSGGDIPLSTVELSPKTSGNVSQIARAGNPAGPPALLQICKVIAKKGPLKHRLLAASHRK